MRRRVFFVIGLTLLAMILVIAAVTRLVLMQSLLDLERRYLERDVDQVRKAVAEDLAALRRTARDWSAWDDVYEFVATRSADFIERNLMSEMLADINVDAILFLDTDGRVVHGKAIGTHGSGAAVLPAEARPVRDGPPRAPRRTIRPTRASPASRRCRTGRRWWPPGRSSTARARGPPGVRWSCAGSSPRRTCGRSAGG